MMGGVDAVRHWIDVIDRDVWERCGRYRPNTTRPATASEIRVREQEMRMLMERYRLEMRPPNVGWYTAWDSPKNEEAEKKAKELFKTTAGTEAFAALDAGKPFPITGSKGTKYTLHKRASYCVERVSDGAKLCAVVPGVPLWDHLLGIKLMVEQDEDKFLKTANVAQAQPDMRTEQYFRYPDSRWAA